MDPEAGPGGGDPIMEGVLESFHNSLLTLFSYNNMH